ncbi:hypothetical protein JXB01_01155 [Candidatus Micrarchaeota archaeon]|nr:hypothetical protein [Candidatus Micrarchaeota archaeon]
MNEINKAFENTSKNLFGKALFQMEEYSEWIERRIPKAENYKSCLGPNKVPVRDYYFFKNIPRNRIAAYEEFSRAGSGKIDSFENLSFEDIKEKLRKIAYFVPDFREGKNRNINNSMVYIDCLNISNSFDTFGLKNSAFNFSAFGENIFGCYRVVNTKFSIHCYNVTNVLSCFEMDSAKDCFNSMFCHNVENVNDSLFCFNTKSKKYAVGNIEVGKEKYLKVKKMLTEKILSELEKEKFLEMDIYNVLC